MILILCWLGKDKTIITMTCFNCLVWWCIGQHVVGNAEDPSSKLLDLLLELPTSCMFFLFHLQCSWSLYWAFRVLRYLEQLGFFFIVNHVHLSWRYLGFICSVGKDTYSWTKSIIPRSRKADTIWVLRHMGQAIIMYAKELLACTKSLIIITLGTRAAEHRSCSWSMQVDWWLQPCTVFGHSFSDISWHMPQK